MNDIIVNIIGTVVTAIILPLITLGGVKLIAWIGTKTKNEKTIELTTRAINIITDSVKCITQTYVDNLKATGNFDKASQKIALEKCKDLVEKQLTVELKEFIFEAFGDVTVWINTQIESKIKDY